MKTEMIDNRKKKEINKAMKKWIHILYIILVLEPVCRPESEKCGAQFNLSFFMVPDLPVIGASVTVVLAFYCSRCQTAV